MSDKKSQAERVSDDLFESLGTCEQASAAWVNLRIRETVQSIAPNQPDSVVLEALLVRFQKYHADRQKLRRRLGVGVLSGSGLGLVAGSWLDVEWFEILNSILAWLGKPLFYKLGYSATTMLEHLV